MVVNLKLPLTILVILIIILTIVNYSLSDKEFYIVCNDGSTENISCSNTDYCKDNRNPLGTNILQTEYKDKYLKYCNKKW